MRIGGQARSIILDLQHQRRTHPPGADLNATRIRAWRDTVPDRIFHQRLEDQIGHPGPEGLRIDHHADPQTRSQAGLFNLQIGLDKLQLLAQGHFLSIGHLQGRPQQLA